MIENKELNLIGYWKEYGEDNYIDPALLIDEGWEIDNREKIINYLNSGKFKTGYFGWSNCRICKCRNGGTELTDGVWYWPVGLAHYVEKHNVKLPDEFIEYMKSVDFECGKTSKLKTKFDWNRWCDEHKR
jgi:hypothetical protein